MVGQADDVMLDPELPTNRFRGGDLGGSRQLAVVDRDRDVGPLPPRDRERVHAAREQQRGFHSAHAIHSVS